MTTHEIVRLTSEEISRIWANKPHTTLQILPIGGFFDACDYSCTMSRGYKRYISWSGRKEEGEFSTDIVVKTKNGGGFFPCYYCCELDFLFERPGSLSRVCQKLNVIAGNYLLVNPDQSAGRLTISSRDPLKYLIMADFLALDNGPQIGVVTRNENADKQWRMSYLLHLILSPYNEEHEIEARLEDTRYEVQEFISFASNRE